MIPIFEHAPDYISSGAFFSNPEHAKAIRSRYTFEGAYENKFSLWWQGDGGVYLPRGCVSGSTLDRRTTGYPVQYANNFKPRFSEQQELVDKSSALFANDQSHIIQAATGYGKTYIGCGVAAVVGVRTLVITTKEDIIDSWIEAAMSVLGLSRNQIGIWRGDKLPNPNHLFVVGLVQSIAKGPERYPGCYDGFGMMICDEVHRMSAEFFSTAMKHIPARYRLGLSATPKRKDGTDAVFFTHIGRIAVVGKVDTMTPKILLKSTGWKLPIVIRKGKQVPLPHSPGRTIHLNRLLCRNPIRLNIIASFLVQATNKGRNTLVFCDTIKELEAIEKAALSLGISANHIGWYIGLTAKRYKGTQAEKKALRLSETKKPVVLTTYKMCSEATNFPWMDTCVLASPKSDVNQIVGRIRRVVEGKKTPVVLDLVDSDSFVFASYCKSRLKWYKSIGATVVRI